MARLERIYNVPLRKGFRKAPRYRKAKKAMTTLQEFIMRHMKCEPEELKIGSALNHKIWERGIKRPPHHVKITVVKEDDGIVKAELFGFKYEEASEDEKVEKKEKKETKEEKKAEPKKEVKKEEKPKPAPKKKTETKKKPAKKKSTSKKKTTSKKATKKKTSSKKKKSSKKKATKSKKK